MDKFFSMFLTEFGMPNSSERISEETILKYQGKLPDCLLSYWRSFGFCTFRNGLVWIVNPDTYVDMANDWICSIPELQGAEYFVFARSCFGNLYVWRADTGCVLSIYCAHGYIMTNKNFLMVSNNKNLSMQSFFAMASPKKFDILLGDDSSLFDKAFKTLGALRGDEVYGFEPLLVLGGLAQLKNIKILRMDVHLDIMRQFTEPVLRLV